MPAMGSHVAISWAFWGSFLLLLAPAVRFLAVSWWHLACPGFGQLMLRPRHRRTMVALPPPRSGRPLPPAHARILVVDDHEDTRELLLTILKTEGYDVDLAEDGEEAVRRYRERPADIVLMDLYMPRRNGIA